MKKIQINLTTFMFLSENMNTILGVFNSHSNVLAYNKPSVTSAELRSMMIESHKLSDKPADIEKFQTDSFSVEFYNHRTGGFSDFNEVMANHPPVKSDDLYNGPNKN